jgi:hypothetical protein
MDSQYCQPVIGLAALKKDMEGKTYEQFTLELLDRRVKDKDLAPWDDMILRRLDRYYGFDFDEWLDSHRPSPAMFRNEELRKGYEPLRIYSGLPLSSPGPGETVSLDERCLSYIIPREVDRAACRELFALYDPALSPIAMSSASNAWRERLLQWYTAARPYLKYDPELGRFVNTAEAGKGRSDAETAPSDSQ